MPAVTPPELVYRPILPELILVGSGIVVLLLDAIRPVRNRGAMAALTMLGLVGAAVATLFLWGFDSARTPTVLGGMV
ncbi:MAG TPA: hypothetical protein VJ868_01420, partial [Actinomycetota bacterium]|nr:hypothetical protein [Actinomycetota bacterium]